jgi:hypothetical protein
VNLTRDMQNSIRPVTVTFRATLGAIFTVFLWATSAGAMPAPTSQQIITPYTAVAAPTINALADASRPMAVGGAADESGDLILQVNTDSVDAPMDAYLAVLAPRIASDAIFLVNPSGGLEIFTGILKPWKSNVTILDETPFGTIPLELLPGGDYFFCLLLAPAGAANPLSGNFYLWSSVLTLTSTVEEFTNAVIGQFGPDVDGPMALLLGFDNGYSLQQIVDAVFANRFTSAGIVLDGSGAPAAPANAPQGLIVRDGGVSVQRIMEDLPLTVGQFNLATAIKALIDALTIGLHIPPWQASVLVCNALAVSQAEHVNLGKVLGAIIAEFFILGPDAITLLDGPADDPNSKPLEGSGEPSGVFRTSGGGNPPLGPTTLDFSGIRHADISLGGLKVDVYNHSSGQTATELGGGGFPGDGTVYYLVNDFSRTQGQRPTVTNFSLTMIPSGGEITVASVVQNVWDSADKNYMISRKTMELTNIPLVNAASGSFRYYVNGESVCDHISRYTQETFNSDGTLLTEAISSSRSCSVTSSLSISLY